MKKLYRESEMLWKNMNANEWFISLTHLINFSSILNSTQLSCDTEWNPSFITFALNVKDYRWFDL